MVASVLRGGGMNRFFKELMDDPSLRFELNEAAKAVKQKAQLLLTGYARSGRIYQKREAYGIASGSRAEGKWIAGSRHQASAPGEPPAELTGSLAKMIGLKRATKSQRRMVAKVSARAPHAHLLEWGTVKMLPRPFMGPAMNAARRANFQRLKAGALRSVRAAARAARAGDFE